MLTPLFDSDSRTNRMWSLLPTISTQCVSMGHRYRRLPDQFTKWHSCLSLREKVILLSVRAFAEHDAIFRDFVVLQTAVVGVWG